MATTTQLVFMIASVIMSGIILYFVYGFRRERGVSYFIGFLVCRIVYSSSIILEKSSDFLPDKLVFRYMQHTALNLLVPFTILFVYQLIGQEKLVKLRWKILLFSVFALWSLLVWLDSRFHVIFRTVKFNDGQLVVTKTVYSILFSFICYSIIAVCIYFLFQYVRNIRSDFRKPGMWVLFLGSLPFVLEIARFANPEWSVWLLPLSVYCGFTGMLMLVIILRAKFFSLVPIARNIVLDTLQESILVANASGKIIDSNRQATKWFAEMGHAAIYGRSTAELLSTWPEWLALCRSMQQGRVEIDASLDGERKIYSVNVYPLHILRKQGEGTISLIVDITEKERHLEQIAQLNQSKDQLFTIVSHDIRSPLALQYQLIELLEEDRDRFNADHRETIGLLGEQIRHTFGMTNNLLEWFRSQREDLILRPQLLELSHVVEECCHVLHLQSEAKHISMKHTIALGTPVIADREVLGLIIRNLLSNAIKFTRTGGSVHVSAQLSEDMVVISVRDTGVGMEEEQVRQLFDEKLLHSAPGTMGEKGVGLGLLVSRQFVQRIGGSMWVESKLGQGSVFYFTVRGEQRDENSYCGR